MVPLHGVTDGERQHTTQGVVLFGKLKEDAEAPRKVCLGHDSEPCEECKKHMEMGIILISVDEAKSEDMNNPWRTGGWVVLKEEAVKRWGLPAELEQHILRRRLAFLPDEVWDAIGLPKGAEDEAPA